MARGVQCSMVARGAIAFFALSVAYAQPTSTWVEVSPLPGTSSEEIADVERRFTPELILELQSAKEDAVLLYTEYSTGAAGEFKRFLANISHFTNETVGEMDPSLLENAPPTCRNTFEKTLKKIENVAHRTATYNAETHHKFILGHMIVFRMHLNKSEEFLRKAEKTMSRLPSCQRAPASITCQTSREVRKHRLIAAKEIHRVREDIEHSRIFYKDVLVHQHRKMKSLHRHAKWQALDAIKKLKKCSKG